MSEREGLLGQLRHWLKPWTAGSEPIEVRRAVLDEIAARVVPAGGGRRLFPYRRVRVELFAAGAEERAVLEALAGEAWDLPAEARARLEAAGARVPDDLAVEVVVAEREGESAAGEPRYRVSFERGEGQKAVAAGAEAAKEAEEAARPPASRPALVLTVTQGKAAQQVYAPPGERVQVGRLAEVLDADGRVRRRNDVVFLEEGEINQTVSREHARIAWDAGEACYWLRDEGSAYGTRIFRDGRPIEVNAHDRRGVCLRDGDELYFGRARVKVALRPE
ncbi:MAG TPA: FHA domain-containing protein [Thermoanaerobaculia bacterium]|nr:FHA domain-containing protein [Thermoanaerobaculia bacterium]